VDNPSCYPQQLIAPKVACPIEETVANGDDADATQLAQRIRERFGVVVHERAQ